MSQGDEHPTSDPTPGGSSTWWAMPEEPPVADPWTATAPQPPIPGPGVAAPPPPTYRYPPVAGGPVEPLPPSPWSPPTTSAGPLPHPGHRPPTASHPLAPGAAPYLPPYAPPSYAPPTSPPGRPPSAPLGGQPAPHHEPPRRGPALAGIALIALIAIVLGLTAGVTLDRALQDRDQRVEAPASGSNGNGSSGRPSTSPWGSGGFVDPSQNGNQAPDPGSTANAPTQDEADAIAAKVTPGLVNINTQLGYQSAAAAGTGMILSADGLVLTNNHVIDNSTAIRATVVGTGRTYEAKVLGTAKTLDVALLQLVGAKGLPTVKLDTSSKLKVGDPIVAAGNAGGRGGDPSVVSGTITALGQSITASDENGDNAETLHELIETNAPIQPGDSGGPLIDTDGEVIGMNTAASASNQFQSSRSVGYAIPIRNALDVVDQIKAGKESDTVHLGLPGILGVQIDGNGIGAEIVGVASGSPADKAGITPGSTITAIDGQSVDTAQSVGELLDGRKPGEKVSVSWSDAFGASHTQTLTLMVGPAD